MLLIFDVDGTIIDSWEEIETVFKRVFDREGLELDVKKLRMSVGLPLDKVIESLVGKEDKELIEKIREGFFSLKPRRIKMYDGVEKVLNLNVKKAILTSKGEMGTYRDLNYLGILNKFDIIIDADKVQRKKPDPEGIFKILHIIPEKKERTFMIGDTEMDILAAKNAGVKSVAVTWGYRSKDFLKKFNPDYMVSSVDELLKIVDSHAHL